MKKTITTLALSIAIFTATPFVSMAADDSFWSSPIDQVRSIIQINSGNYTGTEMFAIEEGVKIYSDDSESSTVLDETLKNTSFEVVEQRNNWSLITTSDGYAFVHSDKLAAAPIEETPVQNWVSLGTMKITHYDACAACGTPNGITASGRTARINHTVAMNRKDAPLGAHVLINGKEYIVDDRGVRSGVVDVFVSSHKEAKHLGTYKAQVYILK